MHSLRHNSGVAWVALKALSNVDCPQVKLVMQTQSARGRSIHVLLVIRTELKTKSSHSHQSALPVRDLFTRSSRSIRSGNCSAKGFKLHDTVGEGCRFDERQKETRKCTVKLPAELTDPVNRQCPACILPSLLARSTTK